MDSLSQNYLEGNLSNYSPRSKVCSTCKQRKDLSDFVKNKRNKDGYDYHCKACACEQNRKRRAKKPDKRRDQKFRFLDGDLVEKYCGVCKEWKHVAEFGPNGNGLRWLCRECDAQRARDKRSAEPTYNRDAHLRRLYGISIEEYLRMFEAQGGVCKACGYPETMFDVRTGTVRSLAVDHCHATGKIRALLCQGCNQALGSLREDAERARALVKYIEELVN